MILKKIFISFSIIILMGLSVGCVKVNYPHREQYMLNISNPTAFKKSSSKNLTVQSVTVVPQFANLNFVYRTSDLIYKEDYYHMFFNAPAEQIQQLVVGYLDHSKLYSHVTDDVNFVHSDYFLRARVLKLYADYRDSSNPKAVISIQFQVMQPSKKKPLILAKTYSNIIPIKTKDSTGLVTAWNTGLTKALQNLTNELR